MRSEGDALGRGRRRLPSPAWRERVRVRVTGGTKGWGTPNNQNSNPQTKHPLLVPNPPIS